VNGVDGEESRLDGGLIHQLRVPKESALIWVRSP
jgi:hypothetical protein